MSILEMISVENPVRYKYCKTRRLIKYELTTPNSFLKIMKYLKNPSGQNFIASK